MCTRKAADEITACLDHRKRRSQRMLRGHSPDEVPDEAVGAGEERLRSFAQGVGSACGSAGAILAAKLQPVDKEMSMLYVRYASEAQASEALNMWRQPHEFGAHSLYNSMPYSKRGWVRCSHVLPRPQNVTVAHVHMYHYVAVLMRSQRSSRARRCR